MGPLVARVMKLFLHFHLVFTTGITFSYLVKVKSQDQTSAECLDPSGEVRIIPTGVFCFQKLIPVSEGDFILKFLEVKFGLNTTA